MIGALILLWLAMLAAGTTPVGRTMRRIAVDAPARWCNRRTRGEVLTLLLMIAGGTVMLLFVEQEGLRLMAMAAPDLMVAMASVEFTSAVDVLAAVLVSASSGRLSALRSWIATIPARIGRTRVRTRRLRQDKPAANDDEDPAALARAA